MLVRLVLVAGERHALARFDPALDLLQRRSLLREPRALVIGEQRIVVGLRVERLPLL
jgi:hypothetical protein